MFLLFCIPGLPFARHHLFFAFKEVERQSEVGCMLGFHWLPEAAVCTAFVWVSSQLLSNLRMQDHVRSRHLKRMYFFSMTCNVVCSGEISLKMFGKTVFTFWYIAGLYGFLLKCFSRWLGPNPGNAFLLVLLECKQQMPEVSGSHFALSHLDVGIFIMKTYCYFWLY